MKSRVKVTKRDKPIDPSLVSMVAELTKGHKNEIIAIEERLRKAEALIYAMGIVIENHEVVFSDLHTTFCTIGSTISMGTSSRKVMEELADLARRSLEDYPAPDYENGGS